MLNINVFRLVVHEMKIKFSSFSPLNGLLKYQLLDLNKSPFPRDASYLMVL